MWSANYYHDRGVLHPYSPLAASPEGQQTRRKHLNRQPSLCSVEQHKNKAKALFTWIVEEEEAVAVGLRRE